MFRVVVTGACGNLASAILPRLVARPAIDHVVGLDLRSPRRPIDGVEYRRSDVTDPAIAAHLEGAGALIHLAFVVMGGRDPASAERVNVGGTRNVIGAAIAAGVSHITYASSVAAYGAHPDNAGELTEDAPLRGNRDFVYSRTKAEVERWLDSIAGDAPPIARMRPSIFLAGYGRGAAMWRRRWFPVIRGGADHPVQLTHQDDVADAFVKALVRRASGAFNIATRDPLPVSKWPAALGKVPVPIWRGLALAAAGRGEVDPGFLRFGEGGPLIVSADKARRELGWRPRFETTAEVLRELSATGSRPRLQTRIILGSLAALTRVRGRLPGSGARGAELRGFAGAIDLLLGGDRPSSWHLTVDERGGVGLGRGRAAGARASVRVDERVFFDLLAGRVDYSTASMAGMLRFGGDAGLNMVVGAFITQLGRGLRGGPAPVRRWLLGPELGR